MTAGRLLAPCADSEKQKAPDDAGAFEAKRRFAGCLGGALPATDPAEGGKADAAAGSDARGRSVTEAVPAGLRMTRIKAGKA